jgi:hypothetical protein
MEISRIIIIIIICIIVSCHRPFLPGTSLEAVAIPTVQASSLHSSTFHIMYDITTIADFCSESIECFTGTSSKFFF